jgi:hypothetical protein
MLRIFFGTGRAFGDFVFDRQPVTSREKILRFRTVLGTPMLRASVLTTNIRLWGLVALTGAKPEPFLFLPSPACHAEARGASLRPI